MTGLARRPAALVAGGILAVGAAACGGDDDSQRADRERSQRTPPAHTEPADTRRTLNGGRTTLVLDRQTMRILDAAGISVRPTGAAESRGEGRIVFPITAGRVDLETLSGRIEHDGALRFTARGVSLRASDLVIRPERGVMTAEVAGRRVPLLSLDFGTPPKIRASRPVVLSAPAIIRPEAVEALSAPLGLELDRGLRLGRVSLEGAG